MTPQLRTRLHKLANDNGFDLVREEQGEWLHFASTQVTLGVWLTNDFVAALSQANIVGGLADHGSPTNIPLPTGAVAALTATDLTGLHRLVRRAFQLSRSLPDAPLLAFERDIAGLPDSTEVERLVILRKGQARFREGLLDYWQGRCCVTGLAVPELLRASHIKPWAVCTSSAERLDVFNGLLLAPHLDAVFDDGYVTVRDDGALVISSLLPEAAKPILGLGQPLRVGGLEARHLPYLAHHREAVFRS